MLQDNEVYKRIKAVDIIPILAVLPSLQFVGICQGSTDPNHPPCSVVIPGTPLPIEITDMVKELELGGEIHRVFLRKLSPGQNIPPHIDSWVPEGWRRFHVPLISHPDIFMRWPNDGVEVYLEPGYLWEVKVSKLHEVTHNANIDRVHIQIDQINATIL